MFNKKNDVLTGPKFINSVNLSKTRGFGTAQSCDIKETRGGWRNIEQGAWGKKDRKERNGAGKRNGTKKRKKRDAERGRGGEGGGGG